MKAKITQDDAINWWLYKYHNTTVEKVFNEGTFIGLQFYEKYTVTQEQHDEWYDWFIRTVAREYKCSLKRAKKITAFDYLNVAPSIK